MHVAIEPAGQRRAKKANEREREKVRSAQAREQRSVLEICGHAERNENDAKDDAHAEIEFDEGADEVKAEEKNQGSSDRSDQSAVLEKERADGAGGRPERNKNDGKSCNEGKSRCEQAGARNLALTQLLHPDA